MTYYSCPQKGVVICEAYCFRNFDDSLEVSKIIQVDYTTDKGSFEIKFVFKDDFQGDEESVIEDYFAPFGSGLLQKTCTVIYKK